MALGLRTAIVGTDWTLITNKVSALQTNAAQAATYVGGTVTGGTLSSD